MKFIHPKSLRMLPVIACLALLAACAGTPHRAMADHAPRPVGGNRDAYGCFPAAGYAWCARLEQCVRPWELAKDKGFENTSADFHAWCDAKDAPAAP
jgi:hypothetical protein